MESSTLGPITHRYRASLWFLKAFQNIFHCYRDFSRHFFYCFWRFPGRRHLQTVFFIQWFHRTECDPNAKTDTCTSVAFDRWISPNTHKHIQIHTQHEEKGWFHLSVCVTSEQRFINTADVWHGSNIATRSLSLSFTHLHTAVKGQIVLIVTFVIMLLYLDHSQ